ncbi:BnaCnng08070D [Brassica napus]|uniref:BnaCnng08070D protein n=1 Tax=Brassica napus TaxID=3708 RepID=A0A078HK65_BRANA|nr:BnaCnng08070D [Brassica napus]
MARIIIRLAASSHIDLKAAKKAKIRDCWSVDGFVRAEDSWIRHECLE